jgi:hypothetical protein
MSVAVVDDCRRVLAITDTTLYGSVKVPSGKGRVFTLKVYSSDDQETYTGTTTADVQPNKTTPITLNITRVTGDVSVGGTIIDGPAAAYRYYRFSIDDASIGSQPGGADCGIVTETHFVLGGSAYPQSSYTLDSASTTLAGSVSSLLDNNDNAAGGFVKFHAPWSWTIDMQSEYTFESLYIHTWETYWYFVPTTVSVYGAASSSGPWTLLGNRTFSAVYDTAYVDLTYPAL